MPDPIWVPERSSLIPPPGSAPQVERMFRLDWLANLMRSPSGVPLLRPDFVARLGRKVRLVDVREEAELTGVLGYIHGSDWVPADRAASLAERIGPDDPVVLVSAGEERSGAAAVALERAGVRFVAAMMGGLVAWRDDGYSTTRDPSILARRDVVRARGDLAAQGSERVTISDIERHVGDPGAVRWLKLPALLVRGLVSCVDGRDDSGVIGSAGGDAGELLVGLRALENLTGRELDDEAVAKLLARRADTFGRFYMHSDVDASNLVIQALRADGRFDEALSRVHDGLEWRRFWASPPPDVRDALLEHLLDPKHVGCGHLRLSLVDPASHSTRGALVRAVVAAFHRARWSGHPDMEFVPLAGGHNERAVVNVRIAGELLPFSRIPLVSPAVGGAQVFVHHPRVTSYLREQLAAFLATQTDIAGVGVDVARLHEEMVRLGALQLSRTLAALADGLPIFDVTFHGEDRVEVREAGVVGR